MPQIPDWVPNGKGKAKHDRRKSNGNGHTDIVPSLDIHTVGNFTDIPPRGWLLGTSFCRGYISEVLAGGGIGKTAVRIAQGLSLSSGRSLTGEHVFERCRTLFVSLEDDFDEIRRRIRAAMLHHKLEVDDLAGWFYFTTPGALGLKLATAVDDRVMLGDLGTALEEKITALNIAAVFLDPFVRSHGVSENANVQIDEVMTVLMVLAQRCNCAVDLTHHISKGAADPGNADRGRGASAIKDAGRLVHTLAPMTQEEAKGFGISEAERRYLIRLDSAKVNLAPPATDATWFKLVGVRIGNPKSPLYPHGDTVQTVELWEPPNLWSGLPHPLLNQMLDVIEKGLPNGQLYSSNNAAKQRAAWRVVRDLAQRPRVRPAGLSPPGLRRDCSTRPTTPIPNAESLPRASGSMRPSGRHDLPERNSFVRVRLGKRGPGS
jgi:hypothetical protein